MTQQDIAPDQSLNIILTKIASNWKLNLREINLDSNNHDYNSKKREAVEQKQQELEDKFLNVYQAKLLEITDFPQKEELVKNFILKIDELKISIQDSSMEYPDSESKKFRESVCDSIKTKLLQKKEELKQKKLERMEAQVEIIYPLSFDVEAKKDPLKTLLQSIIKPWNVELFPTEISKYEEDNFVKNSIKDKQSKFLSIIEFLIKDFNKNEISQTIILFEDSEKLLSSFYSQDSQGYKIRDDLISQILQILKEKHKSFTDNAEQETPNTEILLPQKEEFPSSKIDISKPFQDYINSIIELNNYIFTLEYKNNHDSYFFVFNFLKEAITESNHTKQEQKYCKMCLFYYSALTLSQSLKGENQDGSESQDQLVSDLCMSFDQFNNELTDQEKEIFKRSVVENFSITDINRLIDKFQQELTKSIKNQQELTTYPRNQEKLENILARLENFKEYLEREVGEKNNLNYQLFKISSKEIIKVIIDSESLTTLTSQQKEDFKRYLDSIIIEDPNTKAQLNKDFTLEDLYFLRLKCLISGILNTQNTEKLNSIIVNKIEDFLLHHYKDFNSECKQEKYFNNENLHLKLLLANGQIMDKFVEKLKANSELNSKTVSILFTNSSENPNPAKDILLIAIKRKHSPHNKPNQSITSANSSQAILKTTSVVIG